MAIWPVGGLAVRSPAELPTRKRDELEILQRLLDGVKSPDSQALMRALNAQPPAASEADSKFSRRSLEELGDLDADGIPEFALELGAENPDAPQGERTEASAASWSLYVISWDGKHWRASPLLKGTEPFTIQIMPRENSSGPKIAVIVDSVTAPYPLIFDFKDHAASLVWDSRSEESRYQGHGGGQVLFRESRGGPEMIETGRADPGFLIFAREGRRGFEVREIYRWNGKGFVPVKTEYEMNPDFLIYRFISALHLHDYRSAYALIDPASFLKSDHPSLDAFRQLIRADWPEFLDDQIFEAPDSSADTHGFQLQKGEKIFVYHPTFGGDSGSRLTKLERREED